MLKESSHPLKVNVVTNLSSWFTKMIWLKLFIALLWFSMVDIGIFWNHEYQDVDADFCGPDRLHVEAHSELGFEGNLGFDIVMLAE